MQSQSKLNQSPDYEKKTEQTVHKQRIDAERQRKQSYWQYMKDT